MFILSGFIISDPASKCIVYNAWHPNIFQIYKYFVSLHSGRCEMLYISTNVDIKMDIKVLVGIQE